MLQAYGHFKLVPSHLAFRFYRLACWWALSLGFCDSSNKSSTLEHKRTASLYRIALPLSLISHWLTPTVFVSVSRSDRLACASCLCFDTLIVQWQDQCLLLASLSLEQYILFSFFFFFQIKTSFCLLGQWICQLYCSYIGLNSSSSCFSWFVDSISPCASTSPASRSCLFFLLDSLPAQTKK